MKIARAMTRLSAAVTALERVLLIGLVAAIAVLVLTNVLLRGVGITIAWADELAVYSMILSGFVGASLMLRGRIDPAVLLLHEFTPARGIRLLRTIVSIICLGFGLTLLYTTWRWFDPLGLFEAGFDIATFEGSTFNFIYTDVTPVMGVPTFWFYFVMPFFGVTLAIHAAANLVEDLGWVERLDNPAKIDATEV